MNILPLVFTLLLILSVLTIEKLENFKNRTIVQKRYENTIKEEERDVYNERQARLAQASKNISHRQTTFRGFIDKEDREKNEAKYIQYRTVAVSLIKILYGNATFFKKAQEKRPELVDDLLNAIQDAADKLPKQSFKRIEDVSRIQLEDPELQEVFYRMLKGTIEKEDFKKLPANFKAERAKTYYPLLTFFNNDHLSKLIDLRLASKELLLAIYGNQEMVNKVIESREKLAKEMRSTKSTLTQDEATEKFKSEFDGKQKPEIFDILNYKLTSTKKNNRN